MSVVTPITGLNESVIRKASSISNTGRASEQRSTRISGTEQTDDSFRSIFEGLYRQEAESMDSIFEDAAARYDISVDLLKAVAKTESNFNANAVSKAGAMGVMQLMPSTARSLGVTNPFDARQNIMGGAKCLKNNLDQFNGNVSLALAAYNAGSGSVRKYGGIPPYKETQGFVRKVLGYMNGSPLYAGKLVYGNQSQGLFGSAAGSGNFSSGSVSDLLLRLYASSYENGGSSGLSAVSLEDLENQASGLLSGEGSSSSLWAGLYGGSSTNLLSGLSGGGSTNLLSGLYGGSSTDLLSGLYGGSSANLLAGLTGGDGLLSGGSSYGFAQGVSGSMEDTLGLLLNAATDGSMDEEEYAGMVQVLRMQMMMNANRKLGSV